MSGLHGAWRAVRRFFSVSDAAAAGSGSGGSAPRPGEQAPPAARHSRQLHGLYEWVREQLLDAQRNNERVRQAELRRSRLAKRRSLGLLLKLLNPEQREEFRTFRHFHVTGGSSGNRYRIRIAAFANIDLLCPDGRVKYRLCAHPAGDVPVYDVMAAQMLHLQDPATEASFLRRANTHPALSEDRLRAESAWVA